MDDWNKAMTETKTKTKAKTTEGAGAVIKTNQEYGSPALIRVILGGMSESTFVRLRKNPAAEFPRPLRFGKTPLFNIEEVRQWAASHRE